MSWEDNESVSDCLPEEMVSQIQELNMLEMHNSEFCSAVVMKSTGSRWMLAELSNTKLFGKGWTLDH